MGTRTLGSFTRDELQDYLEQKADQGLSYSLVVHLRWDFKQIFDLAQAEGYVQKNPAILLFVPRNTRWPERLVMKEEEVKRLFSVLEQRERLIVKLAVLAGIAGFLLEYVRARAAAVGMVGLGIVTLFERPSRVLVASFTATPWLRRAPASHSCFARPGPRRLSPDCR